MNRIRLGLLLAFLLSVSPALAQPSAPFLPGYVVTAEGDTLRGEVQDRIDLENTLSVRFRRGPGAEAVTYGPREAEGFGFDVGRRFESHLLTPDIVQAAPLQPLFLQVLVEGEVSLYGFSFVPEAVLERALEDVHPEDRYRRERFAVGFPDGTVTGLFLARRSDGRDRIATVENRHYLRVLSEAFAPCAADLGLRRVRYARRDLVRAVTAYNECVGAPVEVASAEALRQRRDDVRVHGALRGGVGLAALSSAQGRNDARAVPYLGALMDVEIAALPGRTSLTAELSYRRTGGGEGPALFPFEPRHFDRHVLSLSLGPRVTLPGPVASPYGSAGVTVGRLLDQDEHYVVQTGVITYTVYRPFTWDSGLFAEAGVGVAYGGPGTLTVGLRGERTRLSYAPLPRAEDSAHRETGRHQNAALHLVVGVRF